jgi:uncharacterized protein YjbI with pentapeptide repeats
MGDGTKEKPYTREDVLRLIEENGDTAKGLDLSRKVFEGGIELRGLELQGIILEDTVFKRTSREVLLQKGIEPGENEYWPKDNIGALLSHTHLEGANLRCANLVGARLWDVHLEGADLTDVNFEKAKLLRAHLEEAVLWDAHLEGAVLWLAHLEGAVLAGAHLEGAGLAGAHLEGAVLAGAHLEGAGLYEAKFSSDTTLDGAHWGNYILGEEKLGETKRGKESRGSFNTATKTYRSLKIWYTEHGLYDIAGKFYYREMEARRKAQSWKKPHLKIWYWVMRMLCGYGEKPERVIISAAAVIFGLALAYFLWGTFSSSSFWDTLYYSVASFTALGYGQWAPQPTGWAKGVGAAEAVLGVSMLALFLVTFTRKMTR